MTKIWMSLVLLRECSIKEKIEEISMMMVVTMANMINLKKMKIISMTTLMGVFVIDTRWILMITLRPLNQNFQKCLHKQIWTNLLSFIWTP
jgi:hypothetical protein